MASQATVSRKPQKRTRKDNTTPWLEALDDPVAGLHVSGSQCMCLADLNGDGDYRLLVADTALHLKTFKGNSVLTSHHLLGDPVAVVSFYANTNMPRTPSVAVGSGPFVFVYRNMKPYAKFVAPATEIHALEQEVWDAFRGDRLEAHDGIERLKEARQDGAALSARSMMMLSLKDGSRQAAFVADKKHQRLVMQGVVVCLATVNHDIDEQRAVSHVVIGTENREVLILNLEGSTTLSQVELPSVPVFMTTSGLYNVEYRIIVSCRDGNIYTVKNGKLLGVVIKPETQPTAVVLVNKTIMVGCMSSVLYGYHLKGTKQFAVYLDSMVLALEIVRLTRIKHQLVTESEISSGKG